MSNKKRPLKRKSKNLYPDGGPLAGNLDQKGIYNETQVNKKRKYLTDAEAGFAAFMQADPIFGGVAKAISEGDGTQEQIERNQTAKTMSAIVNPIHKIGSTIAGIFGASPGTENADNLLKTTNKPKEVNGLKSTALQDSAWQTNPLDSSGIDTNAGLLPKQDNVFNTDPNIQQTQFSTPEMNPAFRIGGRMARRLAYGGWVPPKKDYDAWVAKNPKDSYGQPQYSWDELDSWDQSGVPMFIDPSATSNPNNVPVWNPTLGGADMVSNAASNWAGRFNMGLKENELSNKSMLDFDKVTKANKENVDKTLTGRKTKQGRVFPNGGPLGMAANSLNNEKVPAWMVSGTDPSMIPTLGYSQPMNGVKMKDQIDNYFDYSNSNVNMQASGITPLSNKNININQYTNGKYAMGGQLTQVEGPSHEQGGFTMGNNELELDETVDPNNQYVYSDKLRIPKQLIKKYNLPKSYQGKTVAKATAMCKSKLDLRDDKLTQEAIQQKLDTLRAVNEELRMNTMNRAHTRAYGGSMYPNGGPIDPTKPVVAYQGQPQSTYAQDLMRYVGDLGIQDMSNWIQSNTESLQQNARGFNPRLNSTTVRSTLSNKYIDPSVYSNKFPNGGEIDPVRRLIPHGNPTMNQDLTEFGYSQVPTTQLRPVNTMTGMPMITDDERMYGLPFKELDNKLNTLMKDPNFNSIYKQPRINPDIEKIKSDNYKGLNSLKKQFPLGGGFDENGFPIEDESMYNSNADIVGIQNTLNDPRLTMLPKGVNNMVQPDNSQMFFRRPNGEPIQMDRMSPQMVNNPLPQLERSGTLLPVDGNTTPTTGDDGSNNPLNASKLSPWGYVAAGATTLGKEILNQTQQAPTPTPNVSFGRLSRDPALRAALAGRRQLANMNNQIGNSGSTSGQVLSNLGVFNTTGAAGLASEIGAQESDIKAKNLQIGINQALKNNDISTANNLMREQYLDQRRMNTQQGLDSANVIAQTAVNDTEKNKLQNKIIDEWLSTGKYAVVDGKMMFKGIDDDGKTLIFKDRKGNKYDQKGNLINSTKNIVGK